MKCPSSSHNYHATLALLIHSQDFPKIENGEAKCGIPHPDLIVTFGIPNSNKLKGLGTDDLDIRK